ncbi:MAG: glycosyl transferase [Saprospiraceae bacterium]|nr:MAG: glycosyl transferase [Saprospiraceae bacterium]
MLSVLIPVYNYDIRPLVIALHHQCQSAQIEFEILCYDDCSELDFHLTNQETLSKIKGVSYIRLDNNVGRSRIRNILAEAAQYDYLLFMDCDSGIVAETYISCYVEKLQPNTLLYGGRVYSKMPPKKTEWYFHWYYGSHREQIPAADRQKLPYHSFMTNNFLIPRRIFQQIKFDERIRYYGHEDTLFGIELSQRKIKILHLDNPLEHLGLETFEQFLEKSRQAIVNLYRIFCQNKEVSTRLLETFRRLKQWQLARPVGWVLIQMRPILLRNLKFIPPDLFLFDLYKLSLLLEQDQKEIKK